MSGFHWNGISGQFSLWQTRMERRSHCGTRKMWVGGVKLGNTHVSKQSGPKFCLYIILKFKIYIIENTLHFITKKLANSVKRIFFLNFTKHINTTCTKKRRNFIHEWIGYTVNTGLCKFVITMCLYRLVYWVTAAKGGLWINGIEQELALQVTDRLHAFVCNRSLENQRIYWQPNSEFIESYKSNCKPMHIILKTRWRHHPKFLLSTKMKKLHGDRHVTTRRAVPFPCGW